MTSEIGRDERCPRCGLRYHFDFGTMFSDPQCTCDDNPVLVAAEQERTQATKQFINTLTGLPIIRTDDEA